MRFGMDDKIRVLHVVGQMDRGGTETLLMNLLRILDRDRFQFDFVEQTQRRCDYDDEIESLGSRIFRCPTISPTNLSTYRAWWRNFFQEHPEYPIVHGHSRGSGTVYLQEANHARRVTIMHCHNNSYGKGLSGMLRYLWQIPLHWVADYNFACSYDSGTSQFGKRGNFEVIKNGIISERFSWNLESRTRLRDELKLNDSFVIGNVARFEAQKNHHFLIEIFRDIKMKCPNSKLLLVGRGTKEVAIRAQATEYGILEDVVFAGTREDVNDLYQAMDVFVLPSLFEGFGMVNIEAQTSGLPCFVSDTVAPEAAVTDLIHYLSLNMSPKHWADEVLNGRIDEKDRRDHRSEIVRAGFDIQTTAERLYAFYTDVMKNDNALFISDNTNI